MIVMIVHLFYKNNIMEDKTDKKADNTVETAILERENKRAKAKELIKHLNGLTVKDAVDVLDYAHSELQKAIIVNL